MVGLLYIEYDFVGFTPLDKLMSPVNRETA